MKLRVLAVLVVGVLVGLAARGTARADPLDDYVEKEMKRSRVPGLALAVLRDGEVQVMRTYGTANVEAGSPVKRTSVFELASVTKQFTAAAIMLLVQDGKLGLDDPIIRHIPGAPADWSGITIRHLLTHTAGFDTFCVPPPGVPDPMDPSKAMQLDWIARQPRFFKEGEGARYSDRGYVLLGMIIGNASGMPYERFVEERIFKPAGMLSTSVPDQWRIIPDRVAPYSIRDGRLIRGRRDWQPEIRSHYGAYSTIEDMARWEQALVRGTVLPRAALQQMWTPARLKDGSVALVDGEPYGLGWFVTRDRGRVAIEHPGFTGTVMMRLPEDRLTVIVLSNLDYGSGNGPFLIALAAAGLADPKYLPPHMMSERPDPDPRTTERIRLVVDGFGEKEATEAMTPELLRFLAREPEPLRLLDELRVSRSLAYLGQDDVAGRGIEVLGVAVTRFRYYRAEGLRRPLYLVVSLAADGRIAALGGYPGPDR